MRERRCAGDRQHDRRSLQQPRERELHHADIVTFRFGFQRIARLTQRTAPAPTNRRPRNESHLFFLAVVERGLRLAVGDVYRFWMLTIGTTFFACSISATDTSDNPTCRIFPASCAFLIAPKDSSTGTLRSIRCNCHRSIRWSFNRLRLLSTHCAKYSGCPSGTHCPGPGRVLPPLVAITSPFGKGYNASAMRSSFVSGP